MYKVSKTKAQRLRLMRLTAVIPPPSSVPNNLLKPFGLSLSDLAEKIVEGLPSSVLITYGPRHKIVMANQLTLAQTGPHIIGLTWNELMQDQTGVLKLLDGSKNAIEEAYYSGTPQILETLQRLNPDGSTTYWQAYIYPFFNQQKEVEGLIIYSTDNTEQVKLHLQAEKVIWQKQILLLQVEDQRRIFNALVESIGAGLFLVGADERVMFANQKVAELLGIEPQNAIGQTFNLILQQVSRNARQPERVASQIAAAMTTQSSPAVVEFSYLHNNATESSRPNRELEFSFFDVHDESERLVGRGSLVRDVTHEKEVERLKSQFISTVSHEMRTPLTGIYGYAELLLHRAASPQIQNSWITRIYEEARQLNEIIDELLDLSRIEAGRLELLKSWFSMETLVQKVLTNFGFVVQQEETRASKLQHRFELEVMPDLPQVYADEEKLTKVLNNLVANAVKYSPNGGLVRLKIGQTEAEPTSWSSNATTIVLHEIQVSIADQGMGIEPEDLARIFELFYRTRRGQELKVRGTGLGLTIAKSLIDLHQGRIWLESQPGKGTTFYFTLPLTF